MVTWNFVANAQCRLISGYLGISTALRPLCCRARWTPWGLQRETGYRVGRRKRNCSWTRGSTYRRPVLLSVKTRSPTTETSSETRECCESTAGPRACNRSRSCISSCPPTACSGSLECGRRFVCRDAPLDLLCSTNCSEHTIIQK